MAASSIIIIDRKKVYTVKTKLLIKRENFPALLARLKSKYSKQEEVQKAKSVYNALKPLGWTARGNYQGITQLIYNDDYWKMLASFALSEIAPFAEDGGYIIVLNTKFGNCKTLIFENGRVERRVSEMRFTDPQSCAILKEDLRYAVTKLLDLGTTADEIHDLVTEQIILDLFRS
jgi:hypothetical protein